MLIGKHMRVLQVLMLVGLLVSGVRGAYANVSAADVVVANPLKGAISQYNVQFATTVALSKGSDDIIVTFPAGTNPNAIKKKDVKVNGKGVKDLTPSGQTLTIRVNQNISAGTIVVQFRDPPGVVNPLTAGSYTINVSTSQEPVVVPSNAYQITSSAVLTSATVTPTSSVVSTTSGYSIQFKLGGAGAMTAGADNFTIVFPTNTTVPNGLIYGLTVNGTSATAIGTPGTRTVQVEAPVSLASLDNVSIIFAVSSGLVNPTVDSTYTLTVATTVETTPVTSNAYTIFDGSTLSPASVDITPGTVNTPAEYTIGAQLGAGGGLTAGVDEIILVFPENTVVPAAVAANDVLVDNGTYAGSASAVVTVPATRQVRVTPGQNVPDGANMAVIFKVEAGINNPILDTQYTLDMATTREDTVTSNAYLTTAAITSVTAATITLTNSDKNKFSRYTIDFNVGGQGRLLGGTSTISVVFPSGTTVPASIASSNVTINGTAAAGVTTNPATRLVTVDVPAVSIANDGAVSLVIGSTTDVIKNPNQNTTVTLQVNTSVENTQVSSQNYAIGTGGSNASFDSINLGTTTVNTASVYTLFFTPTNDVEIGDQIILTFPNNTTIPGSISTSDIEITPDGDPLTTAQSVTPVPAARQINLTTPVKLRKNRSHKVELLVGAGVKNPSVPASNYTMTLRTSDQSTDIVSPLYTITASATAVTVDSVVVAPTRAAENASYRITFTLGAVGTLLAGNNTITVTFPAGTTVPASILSSTVTVNGITASSVITDPGARTVTIITPSTIAGNGQVIINFAVAAGITNPAQGNHTLQVKTSAQSTNGVSPVYAITTNTTLAVISALPNPSAINANAGYVITFQIGSGSPLSIGDQITVDFDDLTGVPALMAAGDIRVNNTPATVTPFTDVISKQVTVTTPVAVSANGLVSLAFTNTAGLTNPPTTGSYTLKVSTNIQPTQQTSPTYTVTPATSSISSAGVTPSVATVNQLATYTIGFNVGSSGALQAGSSTITVIFNDSTTLGSIQASNVTVKGVQAQTVMKSNKTLTITVPPGVTISNSSTVTLVVGSSTAVITNPSVAGNYTVRVHTSVETTPVLSQSYSIGTAPTTVSPALVTPSPNGVGSVAAYTIVFNVGGQGALASGSSTIKLTFPDNTTIPFSISAARIKVNTVALAAAPTTSPGSRTITFTTPVSVSNNGTVSVVIDSLANLLNPSTGGSYTMQVNTSVEVTKVTSQGYTITSPQTSVTPANVTPTPNGVNSTAEYVIGFRVGSSGALQGGSSTITLTMPNGTGLPASIAPSKITVNGTASDAIMVSGQQIILTVPSTATIGNSDSVTVVISNQATVKNPPVPGQYALSVATSTEPTAVASNPYTIGPATTTVTAATVVPAPATTGVTGAYTIDFNVGSSGALQAGSSTITITLNDSTTVATQTVAGATINGVSAQAVSDAASRTVVLTVPASVTVGNSEAVAVVIPSGVITNPGTPGNYTLQVKTSVEGTDVTSNTYIIATATTTVTAAAVTPSPVTANAAAQYTVAFNVGAQGGLTLGSSTITVTFPNNTTIPASIPPANITVNGTPVSAAVIINQSLRTVTFTTPVNVSASGSVTVVFLTAAGLFNPSAASFTLQVRTSVEATNVVSNSYAITPAATTISTPAVSVSPAVVQTGAAYTVSFSTGAQGRLLGGTSTITVTYPGGTTVPASITPSSITVNGVPASVAVSAGQDVTITVPSSVTINNSATVVVVFTAAAGLFNPSTAASYTLTAHTSTETSVRTSNSYNITVSSTSTTPATVTPDPGQQGVNAKYTLSFNTGGIGALQGGVSTVTATFSAGTIPASIATSNVTINGVNADSVFTNPGAGTVTARVPGSVSIGNNDGVLLVIGATSNVITNPTAAGYTLTIRTSVEQTDITSNNYTITSAVTAVDSAFVGPNGTTPTGGPAPQTVNTISANNIKFKLGAQGGLTPGSSTITFTFPDNTVVPTSMIAGFITVNGTTVTAAPVCNALLRTVTVTVPAGATQVSALDTVQVNFSTGTQLRNPSLTGTYRLTVRTSVEATNTPSKLYTITPATSSVSAAVVTPTPDTFGSNAQYRIDFSTGSQGALVAGVSTIRVTFPAGTVIPASINPADVTVNGTTATSVSPDSVNRQYTVTVPASVTVGNNGAISLIFSQNAGIINPDPGAISLQMRTSVELTDVSSGSYSISSLAVLQTKPTLSMSPAWASGDARYAYISEAPEDATGAGTGNWNLFTLDQDGSNKVQVTSAISGGTIENGDPVHFSSLTWTPDGDSLVYTGYERIIFPPADTVVTLQLYQIPRTGGVFKKISPSGAVEDSSSQFGGWLDPDWALTNYAFETAQYPSGLHRIAASLDGNIWVFEPRSTDDGVGTTFKGLVQVTNLPTAGGKTDGLFQPQWSPDRRNLAVVYKDSSNATLSDVFVISDIDSILQRTFESPNYNSRNFDYDAEVGPFAVNDLGDMTKITAAGNTLPSWTPSWSTDGTQIAYSQDQANTFNLDTFSTSPATAVSATNFYVKMRNSNGTGPDSTLIGQASANNAFPAMSNNGQRFIYFQAATSGPFSQHQKVLRLQTVDKFEPPASPKVLARQAADVWRLTDLGFSAIEIPIGSISHTTTYSIFEPQSSPSTRHDPARYIGVSRIFGPVDATFFDPVTVSVHYTDGELTDAGFVTVPEHENRLSLYYFDPSAQAWEKVEDSTVDTDRNLVSAPVTKLGTFGVFYTAPAAGQVFSQIMVYPNPFRPNSGSTNDGDYGTGVIFDLLPLNLDKLDIYNIAGEWVASKDNAITPTGAPGQWRWRGTNDAGRRVASGVYIYVMEAGGERKIGKIAVIR